jgi:Dyp-type peroxidase family
VNAAALDLDDIQAGALCSRPNPYAGVYLVLRVDDPRAGRRLLQRLLPHLASVAAVGDEARPAWLAVAFSCAGLRALGVPEAAVGGLSPEFRQGMAARAGELGDVGDNAPERWEAPWGSPDVHVVLAALAPDAARLDDVVRQARQAVDAEPGVALIWRQDVYALPDGRTSFGFRDGISQPAVEGSGMAGTNPHEAPFKAGEFIVGYPDETGAVTPFDVMSHNGTYVVVRKLHTRVAAFRQYVRSRAGSRSERELLAAKIVGRWPSGAPLVLAPDHDDPALGADARRNNAFRYGDDPRGLRCPLGAHARRANARDAVVLGQVRLHRMIRRGTSYGPSLPPGVVEDDGADRGIMFAFVGAHIARQFEFVKTEWINDGAFLGAPGEQDPLVGPHEGGGRFTVPREPIRRRLPDLPRFVVNRGGEYCFMPGLRALRWIADLRD